MKSCEELRDGGKVAIVGAGPAGTMLARLLQTQGFSVKVFERDASPTARSQGGSLDLRKNAGQRAMKQAGLMEEFRRLSRSDAKAFKMLDSRGKPHPAGEAGTHEEAGPEIDRGDLRQMLLGSLAPDTIAWGHAVNDVLPEADGRWRIEFKDQAPVTADLVVGADGVGSRVRRGLTPVRPRYTGMTMLAGVIRKELWRGSELSDLLGEGSVMFADHHQTIFVQRCSRDLILLYYSMVVAEDWPAVQGFALDDSKAVLNAITAAYHDWSPELLTMLTQVDGNFHRWPLSVMPPDHRWETRPGLAMVGDSSHAMPPFTGKGVNLALLDSLELADGLVANPAAEVTEVVKKCEARMQERTRNEISECLEVGRHIYGLEIDFSKP
ncbi:FAD-dependent oxidoreductase [Brasilonema octagenarum]|uniref:FAD-dependent monooxygenase n=1 Tax=Brasilonema octagenarum UFV-OR1 TaxID=417115 RepID=A0ABX1M6X9_9CYAN|nr:NAD(P)/FAD-dependent oxidoreductase [Brasilonema octagenarum]NMF63471.1 FAD-dependent monooxygenase [Brasilonema octagenarum UFV-OR1]